MAVVVNVVGVAGGHAQLGGRAGRGQWLRGTAVMPAIRVD